MAQSGDDRPASATSPEVGGGVVGGAGSASGVGGAPGPRSALGTVEYVAGDPAVTDELRRLLLPLRRDALIEMLVQAAAADKAVYDAVATRAVQDVAHRKLFVRDLPFSVTAEQLQEEFAPFGEVCDVGVVMDHALGRSKGYGFVTFTTTAAARRALEEPNKFISGRRTTAMLASSGGLTRRVGSSHRGVKGDKRDGKGGRRKAAAPPAPPSLAADAPVPPASTGDAADALHAPSASRGDDLSLRKLFVRNLSWSTSSETLTAAFAAHGSVEEGVVMYEPTTRRSKGYGFVTYETTEGARRALEAGRVELDGREAIPSLAAAGARSLQPTERAARRKARKEAAGSSYFGAYGEQYAAYGGGWGGYGGAYPAPAGAAPSSSRDAGGSGGGFRSPGGGDGYR